MPQQPVGRRAVLIGLAAAAATATLPALPARAAPPRGRRRPDYMTKAHRVVYDWLAANGVDEWIPEHATLEVRGDRLIYTAFRWSGPRGWDPDNIRVAAGECETEMRTVPLRRPLDNRVRAAILDARDLTLIERARVVAR